MAKIVFRNVENLEAGDFIGYAKTDVDLEYLTRGYDNLYKIFDISDEDYDAIVEGTKEFDHETFSNNTPTIRTVPTLETTKLVDREEFEAELGQYIDMIDQRISGRPNHSQVEKAREVLTYLKSIDLDSLTYPTPGIQDKMRDDNKYFAFNII